MSDRVTNVEIEDVLSSIRRLVSDEARPKRDAAPVQVPGKLVLTPAQRVSDENRLNDANGLRRADSSPPAGLAAEPVNHSNAAEIPEPRNGSSIGSHGLIVLGKADRLPDAPSGDALPGDAPSDDVLSDGTLPDITLSDVENDIVQSGDFREPDAPQPGTDEGRMMTDALSALVEHEVSQALRSFQTASDVSQGTPTRPLTASNEVLRSDSDTSEVGAGMPDVDKILLTDRSEAEEADTDLYSAPEPGSRAVDARAPVGMFEFRSSHSDATPKTDNMPDKKAAAPQTDDVADSGPPLKPRPGPVRADRAGYTTTTRRPETPRTGMTLEQKILELESMISQTSGDWDDEADAGETGTAAFVQDVSDTLPWQESEPSPDGSSTKPQPVFDIFANVVTSARWRDTTPAEDKGVSKTGTDSEIEQSAVTKDPDTHSKTDDVTEKTALTDTLAATQPSEAGTRVNLRENAAVETGQICKRESGDVEMPNPDFLKSDIPNAELPYRDRVDPDLSDTEDGLEIANQAHPVTPEQVAFAAAPDMRIGSGADDHAMIDKDMLRDLVSDIVRQELQGALGERITRNVRKLVRREIHRALLTKEFE